MKTYQAKTLIPGFKLGEKFAGKSYVAVPQNKAESGFAVAYDNKIMGTVGKTPSARLKFPDHYGRGFYYLYYYEWLPKKLVIGEDLS